jgi:hypothetical protein
MQQNKARRDANRQPGSSDDYEILSEMKSVKAANQIPWIKQNPSERHFGGR